MTQELVESGAEPAPTEPLGSGGQSAMGLKDDSAGAVWMDFEPTAAVAAALFEHAPVPMLMVDPSGKIQHINSATESLFGYTKEALVGELVEVLVPSKHRLQHSQLRRGFMAYPTSRPMAEGRRLVARKKDGTEISVDIAMNPVVTDGSAVAVVLSVLDNTSRERAERAEFFVKELTHRAKNMFAIILAISRQIAKHSASMRDFQVALESRLNSLSTSYKVFEKENWQAALIDDLVRSQISFVTKQDMPQIKIDGPKLRLQPTPAEYLGLAIHELATNAVKHGALSVPTGAVSIRWSVDERGGIFEFHWTEHDGPPVLPSEREGFGSAILKSIVPAACGGTAHLIATPLGMSWNLNAPLAMLRSIE